MVYIYICYIYIYIWPLVGIPDHIGMHWSLYNAKHQSNHIYSGVPKTAVSLSETSKQVGLLFFAFCFCFCFLAVLCSLETGERYARTRECESRSRRLGLETVSRPIEGQTSRSRLGQCRQTSRSRLGQSGAKVKRSWSQVSTVSIYYATSKSLQWSYLIRFGTFGNNQQITP